MKRVRIPFSLEEYNKGGYNVETRNGLKTRIICSDQRGSRYPIIALTFDFFEEKECICCYTIEGKCSIEDKGGYLDLLLFKYEFEDGDIVIRGNNSLGGFILPYRGTDNDGGVLTEMYCDRADLKINTFSNAESGCGFTREYCLATEDEKQIFFDALAKIGKQWNAENKCIEDIKSKFYFKPKDWCLMSCGGYNEWVLCQFSNIKDLGYIAVGGKYFTQCIPYNDKTKHLLGTIYDATEKYKVW